MKKHIFFVYLVAGLVVLLGAYLSLVYSRVKTAVPNQNANTAPVANNNANEPPGGMVQTSSPHLRLAAPLSGALVASPLALSGEAAGWYFEATFPVKLLDANGKVLASGQARATADWMTTDFVPFTAELDFHAPATATGTLVFKNDNPSGDPARDEIVSIPVTFGGAPQAACKPSGCSGQVCSDKDVITDCIYLSKYACYKTAKCERQNNGECGWTQTSEFAKCLAGKK
jgi:eight-cysteine-cluster-containing protein